MYIPVYVNFVSHISSRLETPTAHHWPFTEIRRGVPPFVVSDWNPGQSDSEKGSSNPSTLLHPSRVSTHANKSGCSWRTPSLRLPTRRSREQPATGSTHISFSSA